MTGLEFLDNHFTGICLLIVFVFYIACNPRYYD
jgi:hypothetical protein